jgi:hypothetical protein
MWWPCHCAWFRRQLAGTAADQLEASDGGVAIRLLRLSRPPGILQERPVSQAAGWASVRDRSCPEPHKGCREADQPHRVCLGIRQLCRSATGGSSRGQQFSKGESVRICRWRRAGSRTWTGRSPAHRGGAALERTGDVGDDPATVEVTLLRLDEFAGYPAFVDPARIKSDGSGDLRVPG